MNASRNASGKVMQSVQRSSQLKLQMKRDALSKLNRKANDKGSSGKETMDEGFWHSCIPDGAFGAGIEPATC